MKNGWMGKIRMAALMLTCAAVLVGTAGCSASKDDGKKVRDLEFSVVGEPDIPQELNQIIAGKQNAPFKLTYSDDKNLYIAIGYGEQATGGFSISVNELYLTDNSIVVDTELKGPEKGENPGQDKSYPYIVIRTEYLENPVVFQ